VGGEKLRAIVGKIIEEAREYLKSEDKLSELADLQEGLDQLAAEEGITKEQIVAKQAAKRAKNGGFENGDYIETETWPAGHKWAQYYAADPERFPEIKPTDG